MDRLTLAVAGSVIAGVVSLAVAYVNWRSSRRLLTLSRQYDLLKIDLERLTDLAAQIGSATLPDLPTEADVKDLSGDERTALIKADLERVEPHFGKVADAMLRTRATFPSGIQEEMVARLKTTDDRNGYLRLVAKHQFIVWAATAVDQQIETVRRNWINS